MHGRFLTERPCRSEQPGMSIIDLRVGRQRIARVQVEWNVQALDGLPERPILRQVVIEYDVRIACLTKSVDESSFEVELGDTTFKLAGGQIRLLHGQSGKSTKTIWPLGNLRGESIVAAPGKLVRLVWV